MDKKIIIEVKNLSISFEQYTKGFKTKLLRPIVDLNIKVHEGEILTLVGASGSGKSLLAHAIMGILPSNSSCTGEIYYKGEKLTAKLIKKLRGKEIAFIPQSVNCLDPTMRVGSQVKIGLQKKNAAHIQKELFKKYGLEKEAAELYPFQLSGGMLRRVLFATSVQDNKKLIIADEPTPGIHPEALKAILNQLRDFANQGIAVILITHDIISALPISDYVTILKEGKSIETTKATSFFGMGEALKTEYAKQLWLSLPQNNFIDVDGI